MIADTIIRAGEIVDSDIVAYVPPNWSLAFPKGEQETTIYLWATETQAQAGADATDIVVTRTLPGIAPPIPGVYPQVGDVDLASAKYGPTGIEYTGTLLQPVITDVKLNIQYGADGTEFTGTLTGGTTSKIKRWDGSQWIQCNSRKMWDGLEWKGM
jgi:hypothetical protein